MGQSSYSLEGNGTDLSKLYPSGNTNVGFSATTTNVRSNFMRVVPNSHFWTDLKQLTDSIEFGWLNAEIGKEFILIGLQNTIMHGYRLKPMFKENIKVLNGDNPVFSTVEEMIEYVRTADFNQNAFYVMIVATLAAEINLSNGLKMNRQDVYKRIDGERNYQDEVWGTRRQMDGTPDEEKPVAEWINYIEYHLSKAKDKVYHLDTVGATDELRKVAALAVRAMEIHGAPERQGKADFDPPKTECCDGDCECKK